MSMQMKHKIITYNPRIEKIKGISMSSKIDEIREDLEDTFEDCIDEDFTDEQITGKCLYEFDYSIKNEPEERAIIFITMAEMFMEKSGSIPNKVLEGLRDISDTSSLALTKDEINYIDSKIKSLIG